MKTAIYHSVNASLYLWNGGTGLLIDGIHKGTKQGFSLMSEKWQRQLHSRSGIFAHIDGLLFTHLHDDHFDRDELAAYLDMPQPPAVYGRGLDISTAAVREISPGLRSIAIGSGEVISMRTVHDGEIYREVTNESFLVKLGGESIFIAGDTLFRPEYADVFLKYGGAPDAAFFNLFQLANADGQEFISRLSPARTFLYHQPYPEDDIYNAYPMARGVLKRYPKKLPKVEIPELMAWVDNAPAEWCAAL